MTLILTSTCKNGIAMCADKRRTLKSNSGIQYVDDLDKFYRFSRLEFVAFNYGVNRICGISWDRYLQEFEAKFMGDDARFDVVVDRFREFISPMVRNELNQNQFDDCVGYVFLGSAAGGCPMVRELFWRRGFVIKDKPLSGLIRSGDGKKYLDKFLAENPEVNTTQYWLSMDVQEGVTLLQHLASIAAIEMHLAGGHEFSDEFNSGFLKGLQGGAHNH
jgi:hypothetical protein